MRGTALMRGTLMRGTSVSVKGWLKTRGTFKPKGYHMAYFLCIVK